MDNKKICLAIFILSLVAYTVGLYGLQFIKIDIRYALFVAEIRQYGLGIFPTLYGKPYTDYNSPGIFLMYLTSLRGAYINYFTICLPGAIISAFTLVLTYLIGSRISKALGLYAVMLTFFSVTYMTIVRSPSLDVYVVLASTYSFYLVYTSDLERANKRLFLIPLCFIFGFIFRGTLGLMIPAAIVFCYYLVNRNWKKCALFALISALVFLLCAFALLLLSYEYGGKELIRCMLNDQIFGRVNKNDHMLYYFLDGLGVYALTFPLGVIVLLCYLKKIFRFFRTDKDETLHFIISVSSWMLAILFLMTVPGAKNPRYVVSIIPAAALLGAVVFINPNKVRLFEYFKKVFFLLCRVAPFIFLIVFVGGTITLSVLKINIHFHVAVTIILLLTISAFTVYIIKKLNGDKQSFALFLVMTVIMVTVQILVVEHINQKIEDSVNFVQKVETIREKNNASVWFFDFGPDGDELKYLVNIPSGKRFIPKFINPYINGINIVKTTPVKPHDYKQSILDAIVDYFPKAEIKFPKIEPRYDTYGLGVFKTLSA